MRGSPRLLNEYPVTLPDGQEIHLRHKGTPGQHLPGPFKKDTIRGMLTNVFYTGHVAYRGVDAQGRRNKRKPRLEVLSRPSIRRWWSEALFQEAQEVRALLASSCPDNRQPPGPVHAYPLSGLLALRLLRRQPARRLRPHGTRYYRDAVPDRDAAGTVPSRWYGPRSIEAKVLAFLQACVDDPDLEAQVGARRTPGAGSRGPPGAGTVSCT